MVFVITSSVRGDIVHFLLRQGRLKNGIPQEGPPPRPNQQCNCAFITTTLQLPTKKHLGFILFCAKTERRQPESRFVWKATTCEFRKWIICKTLPAQIHPGLCTWRISFYFWKRVVLAHAHNSRTLSLGQTSEFSSQHQPVFCISSFQMDLWHFNFKRGRLISLN